ncbi:hypothetical protein PMIN04_013228 [Paraphaeosphaeria minitans]
MPADGEFENGPTTPHHTLGTSLHPDPKRSAAAPTQPSALRTSLWPPCPTVHPSPPSIHPSQADPPTRNPPNQPTASGNPPPEMQNPLKTAGSSHFC